MTHKLPNNHKHGFTLIEIVISTALISIIFIFVLAVLTKTLTFRNRAAGMTDLHKATTDIITDLASEARWSHQIIGDFNSNRINVVTKDHGNINYKLTGNQLIKELDDGTKINMLPDTIIVKQMFVIVNPNYEKPTGITLAIELASKTDTKRSLYTINPISIRTSKVFIY